MKGFYFEGSLLFQLRGSLLLHDPGWKLAGSDLQSFVQQVFWEYLLFSRQWVRPWEYKESKYNMAPTLPEITFYVINTYQSLTWLASGNRHLDFSQ